jgi:hypothetical protein
MWAGFSRLWIWACGGHLRTLNNEPGWLSGIALGYGLDDLGFETRQRLGIFCWPSRPDRLWGPPNVLPLGTRVFFPGCKTAGAWSWPLTSIYCRDQEFVELYLYFPNMPSWYGAQLKHSDNFTLMYYTVLYCTVVYYTVLCYTVLYCTVLYCAVLYCTVFTVLYCTMLYCAILYCTVLCYTVLYCAILCCAVLCCAVLYCTILYCTVLCCTVLYCTVLYYAVLCYTVLCCAVLKWMSQECVVNMWGWIQQAVDMGVRWAFTNTVVGLINFTVSQVTSVTKDRIEQRS